MAEEVKPKADQPRVGTKDLTRSSPSIEYRISSIRMSGPRASTRSFGRVEGR
jgi:hypothetical protein